MTFEDPATNSGRVITLRRAEKTFLRKHATWGDEAGANAEYMYLLT